MYIFIFCAPPNLSAGGGGVEPPTKFSKKGGGLTGSQFLEGVAEKEGMTFDFSTQNKLNSGFRQLSL